MAEYLIQDTTLTAIADAIREKTRESGQVAVADMAEKISGIAADEKVETTVALDFSAGDMEVVPEDGTVFSSVNIPAPATLVPENIADGVDIAGIIGTLAAGGGNVVMNAGTFTGTNTAGTITVSHGLGVIPDLFVAFYIGSSSGMTGTKGYTSACFVGISSALQAKLSITRSQLAAKISSTNGQLYVERHNSPLDNISASRVFPKNATNQYVYVGTQYCYAAANTYMWFAIGGLT